MTLLPLLFVCAAGAEPPPFDKPVVPVNGLAESVARYNEQQLAHCPVPGTLEGCEGAHDALYTPGERYALIRLRHFTRGVTHPRTLVFKSGALLQRVGSYDGDARLIQNDRALVIPYVHDCRGDVPSGEMSLIDLAEPSEEANASIPSNAVGFEVESGATPVIRIAIEEPTGSHPDGLQCSTAIAALTARWEIHCAKPKRKGATLACELIPAGISDPKIQCPRSTCR